MSDLFFNLRIFWFHLQAKRGSLWAWSISSNPYWFENFRWLKDPIELYECEIHEGWACRKDGVPKSAKM